MACRKAEWGTKRAACGRAMCLLASGREASIENEGPDCGSVFGVQMIPSSAARYSCTPC